MTTMTKDEVLAVLDDIAENVRGIHHTSQSTGNAFGLDLSKARAAVAAAFEDSERLATLHENSWDLRCHDMPTGNGDCDIGWTVIAHYSSTPRERVVGEAYTNDPRSAIDAARSAK
jgi:hypothetical protein